MFSAGKWRPSVFLKQWGKRRKQEKCQKRWRRSMTHLNLAALSQAQRQDSDKRRPDDSDVSDRREQRKVNQHEIF
ncbi:hypothetical protein [Escherichia coli]|uniref:hypothetical protein n=1 Tax=Escherichia coli TaxID=562 RepID=UPI002FCD4227